MRSALHALGVPEPGRATAERLVDAFVKGRLVRSVYDIEFTEGGHEHVYEYIPRGEVWIDDDIHENERGFVLFHELHERNLMADGMDYDTAHDESSKLEKHYRKHPDELHEALSREGWE